jgi:hypothetical protein
MPIALNVVVCAVIAVAFWTILGFAVARRLVAPLLALPMAPAFGWAVHSAVILPVQMLVGFSTAAVAISGTVVLIASLAALATTSQSQRDNDAGAAAVHLWVYLGAGLLAFCIAMAVVPKIGPEGIGFATPVFDHSKIAMIDDMVRLGVPPGNPFFGEGGEASRLSYYYLWHFSAAELAISTGASGWEADIALTWFTAFASVMLMAALANWFSQRASAAIWVLLLNFALSLRYVLAIFFDDDQTINWIYPATGFGGWLFQAAWAPQHIAAASTLVLAIFVLARLADTFQVMTVICLGLLAATGFESSIWLGGIVFPVAAAIVGATLIASLPPARRWRFAALCGAAAVLAVVLVAPLLRDQIIAAANRNGGAPIAWHPFEVLGFAFPPGWRRALDLPAFWLVLLPVEFPAVYVTGLVATWGFLRSRDLSADKRKAIDGLLLLALVSLSGSWLFRSTVGDNNDFGWRSVLPGAMVLTILAGAGLSRWIAARATLAATAAIGLWLLGLPEGIAAIHKYATGRVDPDGRIFADTPALWSAVRRHAAAQERIANNPAFLQDVTPWPVNLSWALLANRRSCFAGRELTLAAVSLPRDRREEISEMFLKVFDGEASPADVEALARQYDCRVVVVTAEDGAWRNDPFAASPFYKIVESNDRWRIYRVVGAL